MKLEPPNLLISHTLFSLIFISHPGMALHFPCPSRSLEKQESQKRRNLRPSRLPRPLHHHLHHHRHGVEIQSHRHQVLVTFPYLEFIKHYKPSPSNHNFQYAFVWMITCGCLMKAKEHVK